MSGLGMGLAGYGNAQPTIMALQEQQRKQQMMAQIYAAMQPGQSPSPGQGVSSPQMPPQPSMPQVNTQAPPTPPSMQKPGGDAAVLAALGSSRRQPSVPQPPQQPPVSELGGASAPQQPGQPQLPDFNTFMAKLSQTPGSPAEKGAAMMQMLPVYAQQWSTQNEQNYRAQTLALDKLKIAQGDKKIDIDTQKVEQQQARQQSLEEKYGKDEEYKMLSSMNQDVEKARQEKSAASTALSNLSQSKKVGTPEYKAAQARLDEASNDLKDAMKTRDAFRNNMGSNPKPKSAAAAEETAAPAKGELSQEDLEFTAKKYGMTVDEVKAKLGAQ